MSERRTYRFGPVERHGFLGPVRPAQAATVIGGALLALILIGSDPSEEEVGASLAIVLASLLLVTVPVAGRTPEQWLPVGGSWVARRLIGAHRYRSPAPTSGSHIGAPSSDTASPELALPAALSGLRIDEFPYRGRLIGVASERGGHLLTVVLACRVVCFSLLDAAAQERNVAHWGTVLSGCADASVRRVQWLERTLPAEADGLESWLRAESDPRLGFRGEPILDSYLELIDRTVHVSQEHEVLIAVQLDTSGVRSRASDAGTALLVEEAERIADGLRRAGARIDGALTARHLVRLYRSAFDPFAPRPSSDDRNAEPWSGPPQAGPLGAQEGWDHYRTDGAVHSTHWISGWPRLDVGALFLDPLLGHAGAVRTIAVTFEPTSTERSIRDVEAQVTRDQADRTLRARFGQAETARDRQGYDAARRREAELAAGYGEVRFAGFVTISAPNLDQLRAATADVRRDASRCRLELRAMYGQHADAFTFTLPLCRGLR